MLHLLKRPKDAAREGEVIPPYAGPKCPFYGFVGCGSFYMENKGNACALTGEHSPCRMEMAGHAPEWDKCPVFNHEEGAPVVAELMECITVAPDAFRPKGASSWLGMKLHIWYEHVMGRPYP